MGEQIDGNDMPKMQGSMVQVYNFGTSIDHMICDYARRICTKLAERHVWVSKAQ